MFKKILIGIIIILIILFILLSVWFFFFRDSISTNQDITNNGTGSFFPVNTTFDPEQDNNFDTGEDRNDVVPDFIPSLRQISKVPTSGFISFERQATSSDLFVSESGEESNIKPYETVFRYIERSTGHLFETKENTLSQERLSNKTIPKIQDAVFDENGEYVVLRYLSSDNQTIETFTSKFVVNKSTSTDGVLIDESTLEGSFLEPNIDNISMFKNSIDYLTSDETGATIFNNTLGTNTRNPIFSSPLKSFILQKINNTLTTITSKADSNIEGSLFFINSSNGSSKKVLNNIFGLTTLTNPTGKYVLYSEYRAGNVDLNVLNTEDNQIIRIVLQTLPEKCVWSDLEENIIYCGVPERFTRAPYPESWYKGLISFSDNIYKIDIDSKKYDLLLNTSTETDNEFDITKPQLSKNEEYFLFINKNDLTLWSLDLIK